MTAGILRELVDAPTSGAVKAPRDGRVKTDYPRLRNVACGQVVNDGPGMASPQQPRDFQ